ncbi:MAG: helix-turn-helix domain-containing protein, partial [Clostridiales bacterium]|nr:helix-turn-helix domain-containing protein [Clostridiales bacterium]
MLTQETVGRKIAKARRNSGLSQAEAARVLSVSPQAVSKWERGDAMPDIIMLKRLA